LRTVAPIPNAITKLAAAAQYTEATRSTTRKVTQAEKPEIMSAMQDTPPAAG
jgi:hypothetical protein